MLLCVYVKSINVAFQFFFISLILDQSSSCTLFKNIFPFHTPYDFTIKEQRDKLVRGLELLNLLLDLNVNFRKKVV